MARADEANRSSVEGLPTDERTWLAGALTLLFGIDPIVSLADNSDVEREQIPEVLAWAAEQLVRAAVSHH